MKITRHARKIIFVMSGPGLNCPRIVMGSNATKLRDDYKGSLKLGRGLLRKLV